MKIISFRIPTNKLDFKQLWKEHTSKRYRHNIEAMKAMTKYYIDNVLRGRWGEVSDGKVVEWAESDKQQFTREMEDKMYSYIHDLME